MAQYYIRRKSGPMYGPFTLQQVIHYIREGTIQGSETISRDKVHWTRITNDPAFYDLLMAKLDGKSDSDIEDAAKTVMATQAMTEASEKKEDKPAHTEEDVIAELPRLPEEDEEPWDAVVKKLKKQRRKKRLQEITQKTRPSRKVFIAAGVILVIGVTLLMMTEAPPPEDPVYYFNIISVDNPLLESSQEDPYLAEKKYYEAKKRAHKDTPYHYVLAAEDYMESLTYDHTFIASIAGYLESLLHLYRVKLLTLENFDKIKKYIRIALTKYPQSASIQRVQALSLILDDNQAGAREVLDSALKASPNDTELEAVYGLSYLQTQELDLAKAKFEQAIAHQRYDDQYYAFAYAALLSINQELGNLHDVAQLAQTLYALSPTHPSILLFFAKEAFQKTDESSHVYGDLLIRTSAALGMFLPVEFHKPVYSKLLERKSELKLSETKINNIKTFLGFRYPSLLIHEKYKSEFENFALPSQEEGIADIEKELFTHHGALNDVADEFFNNPTKKDVGIDLYLISLRIHPNQPDIYQKLGDHYAFIKTADAQAKSLDYYEKALDYNPGLTEVVFKMFERAMHYYDHKKAATVLYRFEKYWEKHHPKDPVDYRLWLSYGRLYERLGDATKALENLKRARGTAPNDVMILTLMSKIADEAEYYTDGVVLIKQALKFEPDNLSLQSKLSVLNAKQGRRLTSKKWAQARLKDNPDDTWGLLTLGKINFVLKDLYGARDMLEKAMKERTEDIEGWRMLAQTYRELGENDKAIQAYENLSFYNPVIPKGYEEAAAYALSLGRKEEALKLYLKVQKINFRYPDINYKIAVLFKDLNYPNEAIKAYQLAIELDPQKINYQIELGDYLVENEYYDSAEKYFVRIQEEYPNNVIAMIYIARINRILGNYAKSQAYASAALKLDPRSPDANKELGLAFFYLQQKKAANEYLQKYLDLNPIATDKQEILNLMR